MIQGIVDRGTFARLRNDGFTVRARDLRARHLPADESDAPVGVAYAIPRRVGNAVSRNRIRRRIRGILDQLASDGVELPPGSTLFVVSRPVTVLDTVELRRQVCDVLDAIRARAGVTTT